MQRRTRIFGGILLLVVIGIGLFVRRVPKAPQAQRVVKIGYFNQHLGSVPVFIAEEKGQLEKYGLTAELVPMALSNQATDALVRGDVDLSLISLIPVLNAESKDPGKIKFVSASVIKKDGSFDRVVVKTDSGITSLKDPKLQKIAVFPGTTATNFLKAELVREGVDASKIEFVQMPPQNQLLALQSGAVQAAHLLEPTLTMTLAQGGYTAVTESVYGSVFDQSPIGGFGLSAVFAEKEPELAKKLVSAIQEASAYELAHPDEAKAIIASRFNVAPEVVAKMSLLPFARFEELAPDFLDSFGDVLVNMGEIKTKPDLKAMVYRAR